jgi:osmotically-inducible protein OsmY
MNFANTRTIHPIGYSVPRARQETRAARTADEILRDRLLARLEADASWRAAVTNVLVCNGEVTLQGLFDRAADRAASVAIARAMPGVRAVDDRRVRAREWQAMA